MKIVLTSLIIIFSLPSLSALRITIDPGHGGEDVGAVHGGVVEAKLALQISRKLYKRLKADRNFVVQILRKKEHELSLEKRVQMSKQFKSDLFLSIHANAHSNQKARGTEFYIQNQLPVDEESLYLAHAEHSQENSKSLKPMGDIDSILYDLKKTDRILKSYQVSSYLRKNWSSKKRKMIRQGPFYVLSQNEVPSVLIEVGYLTHPSERKKLTQNKYQQALVKKIHLALLDYAKNMDKLPSSILQPQNAKTR